MDSRKLVLDLHGQRSEEAVREVTLFLEKIRSAATRVPSFETSTSQFYVTIITGSGAHSPNGPILRSVVQRLLDKRGMTYHLERGNGAFRVNALSGHDLYQADEPVDSKVVVLAADDDSFHQMMTASRRRKHHGGGRSFADTIGITLEQPTVTFSSQLSHRSSLPGTASSVAAAPAQYDPLPSQVAAEERDLMTAVKNSAHENNVLQSHQARMQRQHEEDLERAILASRESTLEANTAAIHEQQTLFTSFEGEQKMRNDLAQVQFENELLLAIEQSLQLDHRKIEDDEQAKASEEFLMQKAFAMSEKVRNQDDALMQDILAESLMEQKRIEEQEQQLLQQVLNDSSYVIADNSNNLNTVDEELRRVIEMSKEFF